VLHYSRHGTLEARFAALREIQNVNLLDVVALALGGEGEGSKTEKTTPLPSGLTTGDPTRFIIHSVSWVMGLSGGVAWASDRSGAMRPAAITVTESLFWWVIAHSP
jgi:hypothetical protein